MRLSFILHGLLMLSSPPPITLHHVIGAVCPVATVASTTTNICFLNTMEPVDPSTTTPIYLPRLLETVLTENKAIPTHHRFSSYHYGRYASSKLSATLPYPTYCLLEEKIASIVTAYLGDQCHPWELFIDPFFMYRDGIRSYGTADEVNRALWITPSVNMGGDAILIDITEEETGKI